MAMQYLARSHPGQIRRNGKHGITRAARDSGPYLGWGDASRARGLKRGML